MADKNSLLSIKRKLWHILQCNRNDKSQRRFIEGIARIISEREDGGRVTTLAKAYKQITKTTAITPYKFYYWIKDNDYSRDDHYCYLLYLKYSNQDDIQADSPKRFLGAAMPLIQRIREYAPETDASNKQLLEIYYSVIADKATAWKPEVLTNSKVIFGDWAWRLFIDYDSSNAIIPSSSKQKSNYAKLKDKANELSKQYLDLIANGKFIEADALMKDNE